MRKIGYMLFMLASSVIAAEPSSAMVQEERVDRGCFLRLGTGASFAREAQVVAPSSQWDPSPQGYKSSLGTRPIIEFGLGYEFCPLLSTDLAFSYRPHFSYQKFQTSTASSTPGFLGTKTRHFNLDTASLLVTFYLSGRGTHCLAWKFPSISSSLYPIIGGGVGASQLTVFNFRSTGLPPVNPSVDTSPSFASENQYAVRYQFTYQVLAGLEFRYKNNWALSLGYRWFDIGQFKGPQYVRDQIGTALDVGNGEWKIKFASNELFLDLKVFF